MLSRPVPAPLRPFHAPSRPGPRIGAGWAGSLSLALLLGGCVPAAGARGSAAPPPESAGVVGPEATPERVQRRLSCMGTLLLVEVEAPTRRAALAASEAAVGALEDVEERLSTWRPDSELSRLNRAPVGEVVRLSPELAEDLAAARAGWEETGGAFDPAVGSLVAAWGLRSGGRIPSPSELEAARVPAGLAALEFQGRLARRLHPAVQVEEGGFGKGIGLDRALAVLAQAGAERARLDLGGQVALLPAARPYSVAVRHPTDRARTVIELALTHGSLATSGNGERGLVVAGRAIGHVLDPRSGEPVPDFGSLTVWAADATRADMLSTGLYVLGPERALALAAADEGIGVLVIEPRGTPSGAVLIARCDPTLGAWIQAVAPDLALTILDPPASATLR